MIDEPLAEVTTPQIEALMFAPPAGSSSSEANMSSPDAEITIRADLSKKPVSGSGSNPGVLTSSMPNYDLNQLFAGVQDSGGEGMMAFTPDDENLILMSSAGSELESDGTSTKPGSEMADSTVSMTSWSTEDFSSES